MIVVFDFDSTLSAPRFVRGQWLIADKPELLNSLSREEHVANFGGAQRVSQLESMLSQIKDKGVFVCVVSLGFTTAIIPALKTVGLLKYFDRIYGQDSEELRRHNFVKADLIATFAQTHTLFVDDSRQHIEKARRICSTIHVQGNGICRDEIDLVLSWCDEPWRS